MKKEWLVASIGRRKHKRKQHEQKQPSSIDESETMMTTAVGVKCSTKEVDDDSMISIPKRVFYELLCASSSTMRECRNSSNDFSNTRPSPHCRCCIDYYSSISPLQSNTASSNDIAVGRTPNNLYVRIETDSISIYFHLFIHRLQLYQ